AFSGSVPSCDVDGASPEFPGYRVLGVLGRGGMGVVYRAIEEASGQCVALKTLHPVAYLEPKLRERFLTEAEAAAAARLEHPNIVKGKDLCQYGDIFSLPLDYVEGVGAGPLAPERPPGAAPRGRADAHRGDRRREEVRPVRAAAAEE